MIGVLLTAGVSASELIGTLGFPIVMCGALFWKMNEQDKRHSAEMEAVTNALNNNTMAVQRLVDKLGGIEDGNS